MQGEGSNDRRRAACISWTTTALLVSNQNAKPDTTVYQRDSRNASQSLLSVKSETLVTDPLSHKALSTHDGILFPPPPLYQEIRCMHASEVCAGCRRPRCSS